MKIFENTNKWLAEANPTPVDVKTIRKWINEELDEFEEALANKDIDEMYDGLADCLIFVGNLLYFYNLDPERLEQYADAVNQSNWSKFCKTEKEAIDTVEAYKNGTHPDKLGEKINTYFTYAENYYIVKKTLDNKILKSIFYKSPDKFL
jgi:NTP pyrophosphatase (non-canonical NTP hydrolase)